MDESEAESLCSPCFGLRWPDAEILTFDPILLSRWAAEGFRDQVIEDKERVYVLTSLLDKHHKGLIQSTEDELVEDYRTSGAISQMTIQQFWKEMHGFY